MDAVLVEVYWSSAALAEHKETAHHQAWRDTLAAMMAEPHSSVKYADVLPDEEGWA
jgi:quinol monooxygenase YgiN